MVLILLPVMFMAYILLCLCCLLFKLKLFKYITFLLSRPHSNPSSTSVLSMIDGLFLIIITYVYTYMHKYINIIC